MSNKDTPAWYFSGEESKVLGIKIARLDYADSVDINDIRKVLLDGEFDLLRIKLNASDRNSFSLLDTLNIPFYALNISNLYSIDLDKLVYPVYNPDVLHYEKYDVSKRDLLEKLIREIYKEVPGTYYINPLSEKLQHSGELEAMVDYTLSYDENFDKSKTTFFIKHADEYIGFFSIRLYDNHSEGNLFGILPEFRSKKYAHDIIRFIMQYLHDTGRKYFEVNIQLHNLPSLNTHITLGYKPVKALLNIHINSLLTKTQMKPVVRKFVFKDIFIIIEIVKLYLETINKTTLVMTAFRQSFSESLIKGNEYKLEVNVPYNNPNDILAVVKFYSQDQFCSFIYVWFSPQR